ncbi:hypothetical protein E4U43_001289 [Claviceps pusilla]|uniref:histidine kinase n=1 Tax=Claviceps pusilla TaxID=123648 RepID=A0A9P7N7Z3_9HYPO|nr:hypothetical protein E4U43_001289 [Claviceps pusilla]
MVAPSNEARSRRRKSVTEPVRERETFKYYSALRGAATSTDILGPPLTSASAASTSSALTSCDDAVLTALAQAGAFQTGTDRSLISLFDANYQYIVAEATPSSRLVPSVRSEDCQQPLWLCGTYLPRGDTVCELSLIGQSVKDSGDMSESSDDLPLTISDDLLADSRFKSNPYCQSGTLCRFYAAVPIRTERGINIGVYCVVNESPEKSWTEENTQTLRDISRLIMNYLESKRMGELHRRNMRMNRGLGSFIEGKSTLSGWQSGPYEAAFLDQPAVEGSLNAKQQAEEEVHTELETPSLTRPSTESSPSRVSSIHAPSFTTAASSSSLCDNDDEQGPSTNDEAMTDCETPTGVFSKAANIIRESTEVEGCVFLDATMEGYRSPSQTSNGFNENDALAAIVTSSSDESSEDPGTGSGGTATRQFCAVLGYSTSKRSSIDGDDSRQLATALSQRFLSKLLKRYPQGKVFNFGADGVLQTSDSSEDDGSYSSSPDSAEATLESVEIDTHEKTVHGNTRVRSGKNKKPWAPHREGSILLKAFPGARSVAFTPVWDARKDRWYAGGFIFTNNPTRSFTVEGELSYLRAFGILTMAEVLRANDVQADKAKSDILGSLSHELRSPLHGIVLSAELLSDTKLSVFQGNAAHTIDVCSRTLLDTVDHLLDYSKINSFRSKNSKFQKLAGEKLSPIAVMDDATATATTTTTATATATTTATTSSTPSTAMTATTTTSTQYGEKNLSCNTRLDRLLEEVTESVFAGYTFQFLSVSQTATDRTEPTTRDLMASQQLHPLQAIVKYDPISAAANGRRPGSEDSREVSVILSIDARQNWSYFIQIGAIRRIIMNIFGNALKYTARGTIDVSLTQERRCIHRGRKENVVNFTVRDTGKGIGREFLQHGLFKPFSQEDSLTPGTGLGLSLVKQIVSQLHGDVSIHSQTGVGTVVSVLLPLEQVPQSPEKALLGSDNDQVFEDQVRDLKGLRIGMSLSHHDDSNGMSDWQKCVPNICREWLTMEIVPDISSTTKADLLLWSYDALPNISEDIQGLANSPNVVLCPNALVAYRQSKLFEQAGCAAVFEFISQPIGPRKLARALLLAYTRWMSVSESSGGTSSVPLSVPRPHGLRRTQSSFAMTNTQQQQQQQQQQQPCYSQSTLSTPIDEDDKKSLFSDTKDGVPESAAPPTPEESPSAEVPVPTTVTKFLLVDDNHINLKVLSTYMKKLGLEYDTAVHGKEAVDLFCRAPLTYSCVLMDISMPVMDGFEATRCIRAYEDRENTQHVPIIALSGLASEDAQREAFGSGMNMLLTKPVKLKALGGILESMGILSG